MAYTLDKLIVYMRIPAKVADDLVHFWNMGSYEYGDIEKSWIGRHPSMCRHNYTILTEEGDSWFFGVGKYGESPSEYWSDVKLEFNPAKVGRSRWFGALYDKLVMSAKYVDFKRFDVAIDVQVARSRLRLLKDQRKYTLIEYSAENKTEYLGVRSCHGHIKLYNKALEQKTGGNLTRLELTLDYGNCSFSEFCRIFPKVIDLDSVSPLDGLGDTDMVLYLACVEHPEYLRMLGRKMRKKIEQLLLTTAQFMVPDKTFYEVILTEILAYGNRITQKMWASFTEAVADDGEIPESWKPKEFISITGTQENLD